jgi:hypothetical protein
MELHCSQRILTELHCSQQIFKKIFKYKTLQISVRWKPGYSMLNGWTDRHDGANSRFSQFCEHA